MPRTPRNPDTEITEDTGNVVQLHPSKDSNLTMKLNIRRSITMKYADGTLDNMSADATIEGLGGNFEADEQAVLDGIAHIAKALGMNITLNESTGFPAYSAPTFGYSAPVASPAPRSAAPAAAPAGRGGGRGGYTSNGPRGGQGGAVRPPSYSDADKTALWQLWCDTNEGEFFYDNFDSDYPNIKPKPDAFGRLGISAPAEIKPLYTKNAPAFAVEFLPGNTPY
jgi:hypothetical protein